MKQRKQIAAYLMTAVMACSALPMHVLAEGKLSYAGGLCEYHTEHTAECGYTGGGGEKESSCTHEHTEDCYTLVTKCVHVHTEECYPAECEWDSTATPSEPDEAEPSECTHECNEESGCITKKLNCAHEHDSECGYTPDAEGTPCKFVCEICNPQDDGDAGQKPDGGAQEQCSCIKLCTESNNNPDCPICVAEGADLSACKGNILVGVQEKICTCIIHCTWYAINGDCPVCGEKDADLSACQGGLEAEEPPAGTRVWVSTVDGTKTDYKNILCRYENKWGERLLVLDDISIYYQSPEEVTFLAGTPFAGTTGSDKDASISIRLKDQSDFASIDCWTATAKGDKYGTPNLSFEFFSELAKVKLVIDTGEDGGEVTVTAKNVASGYKCGSKHKNQIEAFSERTDIALFMTDLGNGRWMAEGLFVPGSAPDLAITYKGKTETVSLKDKFKDGFSEGWIYSATLSATSENWSVSNVQENMRGTWKAYLYTGDFWNRNRGELVPAMICGAPVFMDECSSWGFTPETALTGKVTVPAHTETVQMKDLFFSSPDNKDVMTFQEGSKNEFLHKNNFGNWLTEVYFQTDGSSDWSTEPIALLPGETKTVMIRTDGKYYAIEMTRDLASGSINIIPPTFEPVYVGYDQPIPKPITIQNSGDQDVTLTSLSKTDGETFTVQGIGVTNFVVPAGKSNTSFTVQPGEGWGVGEHTATITAEYGNGQTASAIVRFVVLPRPYDGGGSSGGSVSNAGVYYADGRAKVNGEEGIWKKDETGWWYQKRDGSYPVSCWQRLSYENSVSWYRFDERGYMQTGWFTDGDGKTYYLHAVSDGRQGYMYTGWHQIGGIWYYFGKAEDGTEGALLKNTYTPDGYMVDETGAWKP